ncbi:unnamed protein product [Boreogadus saida]
MEGWLANDGDDREEEEPDADTRGADQLPQDQIQTGEEIETSQADQLPQDQIQTGEEIETSQADQQRDDAEIGGPTADPLRAVSDSSGTGTDPKEG